MSDQPQLALAKTWQYRSVPCVNAFMPQLAAILERRDLSQAEVGRQLGIDTSVVSAWAREARPVSLRHLPKLQEILGYEFTIREDGFAWSTAFATERARSYEQAENIDVPEEKRLRRESIRIAFDGTPMVGPRVIRTHCSCGGMVR